MQKTLIGTSDNIYYIVDVWISITYVILSHTHIQCCFVPVVNWGGEILTILHRTATNDSVHFQLTRAKNDGPSLLQFTKGKVANQHIRDAENIECLGLMQENLLK